MATIFQQNNKDQSKQDAQNQGQVTLPGSASPAFVGNAQQAQNKPASSGNFTNTQAMLAANKQAGQQIGGRIQSGINRQLGQETKATEKETQDVRAGIEKAQGNVKTGAEMLGQIGGDTSKFQTAVAPGQQIQAQKMSDDEMMAFANDANKLKQFTDYRTGQVFGQDKAMLDAENQEAAARAQQTMNVLQGRQGQLSTEANRAGLLGEFLGRPGQYGKGAQRLDQLFLQRDPNKTVKNLQENLNARKTGDISQLVNAATNLGTTSEDLLKTYSNLGKDLQTQTGVKEQGLINELTGRIEGVNKERTEEQQKYKDYLDIMKGTKQGSIDDAVWKDFGLQEGANVFNTFDNIQNIGEIANISQQMAKDYRDTAKQRDVDVYGAISKLAGLSDSEKKLTQAANLEKAAQAKSATDQNSLINRIINQYNTMLGQADQTNFTGIGKESYRDSWGKGGESTMERSANMGQLLRGAGLQEQPSLANFGKNLPKEALTDTVRGVNNAVAGNEFDSRMIGLMPDPVTNMLVNNAVGDIGRSIGNVFGGRSAVSGAEGAAAQRAQDQLNAMIQQWQKEQGMSKAASRTGIRDVADFKSGGAMYQPIKEGASESMPYEQLMRILKGNK
jgi:hypothetical protein